MRLIDLRINWLLQYSAETTVLDSCSYPDIQPRLGQIQGYLQTTRAAIFSCSRSAQDWVGRSEPWKDLGQLLTMLEAEFPGRLLIGPEDFGRFQDDRGGLTWGLIGVAGFDTLIRSAEDLDHLPSLFARGVRVFQPVEHSTGSLGGSVEDKSGLTELGRRFLDAIESLVDRRAGIRPLIDLSGMGPSTLVDALNWFDADPDQRRRSIPILSKFALGPDGDGLGNPGALEALARIRALGGYIGLDLSPASFETPEQMKDVVARLASIPFEGRTGVEGIGISTRFLSRDRGLPGLGTAEEIVRWFQAEFDRDTAKDLLHDNGLALISLALGVDRAL